jgi:hypothetical protein
MLTRAKSKMNNNTTMTWPYTPECKVVFSNKKLSKIILNKRSDPFIALALNMFYVAPL